MNRQEYNPAFIYPPDIDACKKHRLASRIWKGTNDEHYDFHKCPCCSRSMGDQKVIIPFCYDPVKQFTYLGPGVPLMFIFMRLSIILLAIFFILHSIYAMITNLQGSSCDTGCQNSFFLRLSIANKIQNSKTITIQNYLLMTFIILFFFILQYLIYQLRKGDQRSDDQINSPSDYALLVSQLPEGVAEKDLLEMIHEERGYIDEETRRDTNNLAIKQLIMSVQLSQYLKEYEEEEQHFLERKKKDPNFNYNFKHIPKPTAFSSFAIILFHKQEAKEVFDVPQTCYTAIRNILCNLCLKYTHFRVKDKMVVCERAPEPDDILWKNADKPRGEIIRNKIITYIVSAGFLVLGGYIQYILQLKKRDLVDQTIISLYNIISSLSIFIFNLIISFFMIFMSAKEGDCTQTNMNSSILVKTSLLEFFNAGIFYTFAKILAEQVDNFNIQGNQSYELTLFMAINAVGTTTANIIITRIEFPACIQRCLFLKDCLKYNQKNANQIFQYPAIDFPLKYTFLIRTIWLTCFYATFVPIVVPISVIGLLYFYFSEVYLFRNYYAIPFMVSKDLVNTAIWLLSYTGLVTLIGGFLVVFYISNRLQADFTVVESIPFIIGLIVSLVIIFVPSSKINKMLFKVQNANMQTPTYDEAFHEFTVTYQGTNPLSTYGERMKRGEVMMTKIMKMHEMKSRVGSPEERYKKEMLNSSNPLKRLL